MNENPIQTQGMPPIPALPSMICFRVTRFCNARCGFCLAPPDGGKHPDATALKERIHWLLSHRVKTIHFCGGEPTIHHALPELISYVSSMGGKSKMTTNGMAISDQLIATLRSSKTEVKVSLHGDEQHHNRILGRDAFDKTTDNIKRLLKAGIATSVQTTIISGHLDMALWGVQFCIKNGVRRVSFLPFIPRGWGNTRRSEYGLSLEERKELRKGVSEKRREYIGQVDIRLLDFNTRPIHVVEPDGSIVLESATEALDKILYKIVSEKVDSAK